MILWNFLEQPTLTVLARLPLPKYWLRDWQKKANSGQVNGCGIHKLLDALTTVDSEYDTDCWVHPIRSFAEDN